MKIRLDAAGNNQNVDKVTTSYGNTAAEKKKSSGIYTLDISGIVMDNNAYTDHGRTAEDVMQEAGMQDLTWQRNYMIVMSNSMSREDFARMQEEGFHPGSMEIEDVVTIVDKIKAELVKSGKQIVGFTDTLDRDTLMKITGDEGLAEAMLQQFQTYDVPASEENAEAVMSALSESNNLQAPEDGAVKYLVENEMEPTMDNLYLAEHSGAIDASRQAKGYYNMGANGYMARKADNFDWQQLMPQIAHIVEDAGFAADDAQAIEDGKWLLEKGVELTPENLQRLSRIKNTPVPPTEEQVVQAAVVALADGKSVGEAVPGTEETLTEQAQRLLDTVEGLSEQAADLTAAEGKRLTLRNLLASQRALDEGLDTETILQNIQARRILEEVRLQMSLEANRMLLKKGYSIDTAPMEELIGKLKQAEAEYQSNLFAEADAAKAQTKADLYEKTVGTVAYLQGAPAAVIGSVAYDYAASTLSGIEQEAKSLQAAYEKAGESYETLMTAPRADLGDSIQKAFRNVDDILENLQLEATQDNRRAMRILGYNRMEITTENIEMVKSADTSLQRLLKKMTPASVLQMIRDEKNPLEISMEELSDYLDGQAESLEQDTEKYSKFLYKLEKNDQITEEEKTSFIGIYRMMRALEKNDGAAIGALLNQGADLTFENLLTAVRSRKKGAMDYKVDDSFGGIEQVKGNMESISGQIQAAYTYAGNLVHEIYDGLTPELLQQVPVTPDMTLAETAEAFREAASFAESDQEAALEQAWVQEQATDLRQAARVQEGVLETLLEYGQPVTADNLTATQAYLQQRGTTWKSVYDKEAENGGEKRLQEAAEKLTDSFTSKEEAQKAYEELTKAASELLLKEAGQSEVYLDVKELSLLHKQISLFTGMSREECYEIPASIDGELTAIRLKIRHAQPGTEKGNVVITCQTRQYGNVAGEFTLKYKVTPQDSLTNESAVGVDGYIACESDDGAAYFAKVEAQLDKLLVQEGLTENRIRILSGNPVRLDRFREAAKEAGKAGGLKAVQETGRTENADAGKILYRTAKSFLKALKSTEEA